MITFLRIHLHLFNFAYKIKGYLKNSFTTFVSALLVTVIIKGYLDYAFISEPVIHYAQITVKHE